MIQARGMAGGPLSISVIIPVHDGADHLRRCLASAGACAPAAAEIIVVDDASSDDSLAVAREAGARTLRLPVQSGPAHARNCAAQMARGDVLLFVDADVLLRPDATAQVLDAFAREPHLAAVFGSYDDAPVQPNFLSQYKNLLHHYVHQTARAEASTFWAGCGAIRRAVFAELGGFDPAYRRASVEDIELGIRLRRAGHAVRLRKTLQATHLKRWTARSLLIADIRDRALPWTALLLRAGRVENDLNLRWPSRVSAAAVPSCVAALCGAAWWPPAWLLVAALSALLLVLNAPLYRFFVRQRGVRFAVGCILWHWLYYLYSGAAFVLGGGWHLVTSRGTRSPLDDRADQPDQPSTGTARVRAR
jgi:glycosyltransferase involved in cell wall biosynthesis